ncbi:MAG: hypothetical protein HZC02_01165 [Candidatus Levybacteria bacterium]|nr:hypothetical protein [Candidatus Levybacteria bacterium]
MTHLKNQAIQTALTGDWLNAISLNKSILEENPNDIDTLNRLGFALSSVGDAKEAKIIYQKVLSLDAQNPIALRNLKRLSSNTSAKIVAPAQVSNLFIEEPGRTKIIELLNSADKKVISILRSGEILQLAIKRMKIFVLDQHKQYVGMLPDDIGRRLIRFMNGGNTYEAYVKSVDGNKVTIFAREVKRTSRFKNQPSFSPSERPKLLMSSKGKGYRKYEAENDEYESNDETNHTEEE